MKIKANKKYIDSLGNISISKRYKKNPKKYVLTIIDNINQKEEKIPPGRKDRVFKDAILEGVIEDSPYNPIKRFTIIDEVILRLKRAIKKHICERIKKRSSK